MSELACNKLANVRRRAERASNGHTCPASRHVMMMADVLAAKRKYPMFDEDPEHCAASIYVVLESLWKARARQMKNEDLLSTNALSTRQKKIGELVALGLKDKEIAQRLGISVETVAFHLRKAFRKLGIDSRVQFAVIIAQPPALTCRCF